MNIYFDIETIPGPIGPSPEEVKAPRNYKDPDKILAYKEAEVEKLWRKQSLCSVKGRLLCIGWAVEDDAPETLVADYDDKFPGKAEKDLLVEFWKAVTRAAKNLGSIYWVGFNIKSFDLNWLYHRAVKYGLRDLALSIPRQRYNDFVIDIREKWNGGDWKAEGALDDVARFLGVGRKTPGIDGSRVFDFWQEGRLDEIAYYCAGDVRLTRSVYRAMRFVDAA